MSNHFQALVNDLHELDWRREHDLLKADIPTRQHDDKPPPRLRRAPRKEYERLAKSTNALIKLVRKPEDSQKKRAGQLIKSLGIAFRNGTWQPSSIEAAKFDVIRARASAMGVRWD